MYMSDENNNTIITESDKETSKPKENGYSIYEYLKKNTSILIAVVSALIAVVTMILKFGSYLYHIAYLNYWNIDPKLVSTPETYWLQDIALSFALLVTGIIYMSLMNETMSTFRKHKIYIKTAKKILSNNDFRFNKSKKTTKGKKPITKKHKDLMDNLDIKLNKNEYEELKKWCKQANINAWRQVIGYFVLLEIIWGVVIYIAYLQQGNIHSKSLILFLAAIFISGLFIAITGYFFQA